MELLNVGALPRPEDLKNLKRLADFGAPDIKSDYAVTLRWMVRYSRERAADIPESSLKEAQTFCNEVYSDLAMVDVFNQYAHVDAADQAAKIGDAFRIHREYALEYLRPQVARDKVEAASMGQDIATLWRSAKELHENAEVLEKNADALLTKAEIASGATATSTIAHFYADQAATHGLAARRALFAMIALSVTLALVGIALFWVLPSTDWTWARTPSGSNEAEVWSEFARQVLAKVFILGSLSFGVAFASKIYRTNSHLQAVYEQKAKALQTFKLLVDAAGDDAKELILAELVRAVFTSADTGVLDKATEHTIVDSAAGMAAILSRAPRAS